MDDIIMKIYEALINNEEIMKLVSKNNIKFFDYPNAQEIKDIVIVIDPLDTPKPDDFADNDNLTYEYLYQIDVFVKQNKGVNGRVISDRLVFLIQRIMWEVLGFGETSSIKPEYIKEFNIYRQAKRFEGKQYFKI
ncbi:hypothetical protein LZT85_04770 [Staphylococcus epidermidis]|jgi:hypothetical protein|uniref:Uncharacterized protein n=2 Tax=root TaxID=1 RepID=A0A8X8K765_STAEP|nr:MULTISPECIES: hypothetical protein [Staphylococcus]ASN69938.1 hypothetical protein 7S8_10 [uncultured Caudovirales phage]WNM54475.1 tail terminator [Staphylococcus phage S-CoN_Ph18]WNM54564.1 tail terminator [Staphylococcus phage S-CoN_Ph19]WNM54631.1 tail terminator [Staphylococcus phage S-CoN_Ph20]WNM54734.1 tail terminator [Staphylococcus phage S-CoN_Ph21]WNM54828.1 tail terminator [Staphylococcus phage S-CoN_Ph22]WNM54873.1 tail terminator [Staphylococcus phage S-CoN_Ph23]WNM54993.1 